MLRRDRSLAEKIGQLFMVGFEGTAITPQLADWMETYGWGGVILFSRNVESPAQLLSLTRGLQTVRRRNPIPLLIAVDQEGGRVARLKAPFTAFPSAAKVGQTASEPLAYEVGRTIGRELCAVGINMNMAPVLDVLTNPANTVIGDRAFGPDPQGVARLGLAFIRGLHAAGVLAVAKHFPGHGDTRLDSHVALPCSERSEAQLRACELRPFQEVIGAGLQAIMTAHVIFKAWDTDHPATVSSSILCGILRTELGFSGVIVSDDLGMAAVSKTMPWEEVPLRALRAGVDLLLICHQRRRQEQAYTSVLRAVECGKLAETVVDGAVARVQALKSRFDPFHHEAPTPPTLACIGSAEHQAAAAKVVEQCAHVTTKEKPHGV